MSTLFLTSNISSLRSADSIFILTIASAFITLMGALLIIAALHDKSKMGWTRNVIIELVAGIILTVLGLILFGVAFYFISKS